MCTRAEHSLQQKMAEVRRVLVTYCGGTFGMVWNDAKAEYDFLSLQSLEAKVRTYPTLCDEEYSISAEEKRHFEPFRPMALPFVRDYSHRVLYCINEYDPLMDSSNMNMDDWAKLARDIESHYDQFDGFVILHGTDTMCYTASALSFMLENLGKPVILTGAQLPLTETRSDAHGNMLGALLMAGSGYALIPEVCIYFCHQLFRGNRSTKTSSTSFSPYASPNLPPLATLGMNISIHPTVAGHQVRSQDSQSKFRLHPTMCPDVGTLSIFPGMTPELVEAFLQAPLKGAVLQTYGAGHFPTLGPLLEKVREASKRGVVVVNCSQCVHGTTHTASKELCELGVVSGADLTVEAALTKLSHLLGRQDLSVQDVRESMEKDIRGEVTVESHTTHRRI